jgi:hypothetical protein
MTHKFTANRTSKMESCLSQLWFLILRTVLKCWVNSLCLKRFVEVQKSHPALLDYLKGQYKIVRVLYLCLSSCLLLSVSWSLALLQIFMTKFYFNKRKRTYLTTTLW